VATLVMRIIAILLLILTRVKLRRRCQRFQDKTFVFIAFCQIAELVNSGLGAYAN